MSKKDIKKKKPKHKGSYVKPEDWDTSNIYDRGSASSGEWPSSHHFKAAPSKVSKPKGKPYKQGGMVGFKPNNKCPNKSKCSAANRCLGMCKK